MVGLHYMALTGSALPPAHGNEEFSLALSTDGASKTTPITGAVDTLRGISRVDTIRSLLRRELSATDA
jgi:hypothetical protein